MWNTIAEPKILQMLKKERKKIQLIAEVQEDKNS